MEIPLYIILVIYLAIMLMFLIFSAFNFYHLWRFGTNEGANYFMIGLYILLLLLVIVFSWRYVASIDWSQSIQL